MKVRADAAAAAGVQVPPDLKEWYKSRLAEKMQLILEARDAWILGDPGAERRIVTESHNLRVTARLFGYEKLVGLASTLETAEKPNFREAADKLIEELLIITSDRETPPGVILLVEPNPERRQIFQRLFASDHCQVLTAESAAQAEKAIFEKSVHLLLMEILLPDMDGRTFLRQVKTRNETATMSVIAMASEIDEPLGEDCMALGADAFFRLPVALESMAEVVMQKLAIAVERRGSARVDALTGLPTRTVYCESLERGISFALRSGNPLSVALVEIDGLGRINREEGRRIGDAVIPAVAGALKKTFRTSDMAARWSGGCFACFFPNTPPGPARRAIEKALENVKKLAIRGRTDQVLDLSISAGVIGVKEGAFIEEVLARSMRYLLQAELSGAGKILADLSDGADYRLTALIAEDDRTTREVLVHRFQRDGFDVDAFSDGAAALEAVLSESKKYMLTVVNAHLPKLNGLDFIRRVRAVPSRSKMPILLIAVDGSDVSIAEGLSLGANDYITKPFSPLDLMARVRRMLRPT